MASRARPRAGIAISAAFVRPGAVGGAEQALYATIEGLDRTVDGDMPIDIFAPDPLPRGAFDVSQASRVAFRGLPRHPRNRFLLDAIALHRARDRQAILFPNYFTPPGISRSKTVTVINDLQYLHYPEHFSWRKRMWLRAAHELTLRRADATVAISDYVRRDILRAYGAHHAPRVHVIPWPIRWTAFDLPAQPSEPFLRWLGDHPFVLSVAAHYRHKNLETLVRGFARASQQRPELRLVLVGQRADLLIGVVRARPIEALIHELGVNNSVFVTGYVDDSVIGWLYGHAALFAFPSVFEGMGRPPVEALGMGLPVLTTRCTAIPEMTRGLAAFVENPHDVEEMSSGMLRIMASRADFVPAPADVARIRHDFSPEVLGGRFRDLLLS